MKIMVHACPARMWYVEQILIPMLRRQGAEDITIWNDVNKRGNLQACMDSFAALKSDGGTWHLQDDVLPCRDFVKRCQELDDGVVYGFCNEDFTDNPSNVGRVYAPDVWHSFQCVRIPDAYARECADWFEKCEWRNSPMPELQILVGMKKGDDTFFREFLQMRHGTEQFYNAKPNLVEHVDWIIGGSILSPYREFYARAYYWDDDELIEELKKEVKRIKR